MIWPPIHKVSEEDLGLEEMRHLTNVTQLEAVWEGKGLWDSQPDDLLSIEGSANLN